MVIKLSNYLDKLAIVNAEGRGEIARGARSEAGRVRAETLGRGEA